MKCWAVVYELRWPGDLPPLAEMGLLFGETPAQFINGLRRRLPPGTLVRLVASHPLTEFRARLLRRLIARRAACR